MKTKFIHKLLSTISLLPLLCVFHETWALEEQVLFTEVNYQAKKWTDIGINEKESLKELAAYLRRSVYGQELWQKGLRKAQGQGQDLLDIIEIGKSSFTDTSLIRRFDLKNPEEVSFKYRSVINLNGDLNFVEGVLDLAHELTHFIYRKSFNPYETSFQLAEFIKNTIEGNGGEVDAYVSECRVLYDLFTQQISERYFCQQVYNTQEKTFNREQVISEFYKIGPHYRDFHLTLERLDLHQQFPYLSSQVGYFVSSVYGTPYPLAALKEYSQIKTRACQNDESRVQLLREKIRGLDSGDVSLAAQNQSLSRIEKSFFTRCNDL